MSWIKKKFLEIYDIAQTKPLFFFSAMFMVVYGVIACIISAVELSFYIGITGSYSLILGVYKIFALYKYKHIKTQNGDVEKIEKQVAWHIAICVAVLSFLHFSFAIVSTFFYDENPSNYGLWFIIFIASVAFVKIVLNTIQSILTRKNHSIIIHYIKLADIANALIALALLQRAILFFTEYPYAKIVSGIGGVFFSLCAVSVCLIMFLKYRKY